MNVLAGFLRFLLSLAWLVAIVYAMFAAAAIATFGAAIVIVLKAFTAPCPTAACTGITPELVKVMAFSAMSTGMLGSLLGALTFRR